jgi:Thioesterase-like superfamily
MGIVHTPRVIATIARSFLKQSKIHPDARTRIGLADAHKYEARAGLFDIDYLGHMNNAAYLYHAEYARWAMSMENGWIQAMMKNNSHFVVSAQSCRYRAEIRPVFRKFEVESILIGIDDKNMWMYVDTGFFRRCPLKRLQMNVTSC